MTVLAVSDLAKSDIRYILLYTLRMYGNEACSSYEHLIKQAMEDILISPSRMRAEPALFEECYLYHLNWSIKRARRIRGVTTKAARHFLVCEKLKDRISVLSVMHDSQDLPKRIANLFLDSSYSV